MTQAIVTVGLDRDAAEAFAASNDRRLMAQAQTEFLPYEFPFKIGVEILEVKGKKNYDSRGVFVQLRVLSSLAVPDDSGRLVLPSEDELKVGKEYTLAFFDQHKTMPDFVLGQQVLQRRAFAACLAQENDTPDFDAAKVLVPLHLEVEPLGIQMTFTNRYLRTTRASAANPKGKRIHALDFALGLPK